MAACRTQISVITAHVPMVEVLLYAPDLISKTGMFTREDVDDTRILAMNFLAKMSRSREVLETLDQEERECRERFGAGGPFLFGAFGAADCFYAPVVFRFLSYGVPLDATARAYCDAIPAHASVAKWPPTHSSPANPSRRSPRASSMNSRATGCTLIDSSRAADAALFRAKELGRNRLCIYDPALLEAASNRFRIEQALRRAIDADASNLDAYSLLAGLYVSERKFDQALAEFDKAIALNPRYVLARYWYAMLCAARLRPDQSVNEAERAVIRSYAFRSITAPMKLRKSHTSPIRTSAIIATIRSRTSFQIERGT